MTSLLLVSLLFCVTLTFSRVLAPCSRSIHVVGMSGHGKSTIARSLTDDNNLISGNIETTAERMTSFSKSFKMLLYDYPGFGSPKYSLPYWIREYKRVMLSNDSACYIVLLVIGNRIYEQHKRFVEYFRGSRLIIVRSQMDIFPINKEIFKGYCRNTLKIKIGIPILFFSIEHSLSFQRRLHEIINGVKIDS